MDNKLRLGLLLLLSLACSGCWDLEEINRRLFVTALGIDLAPNRDLVVTVQVPLPEAIHISGATETPVPEKKVFNTLSVTAPTVFEGFWLLQTKTNGRLVIQENKVIIVSEPVARLGIDPVLAWFARSPKANPQALIYIVRQHTAKELLSFDPAVKRLPGQELTISSQSEFKYDLTYYLQCWQFRQKLLDPAKDPFAPLIDYSQAEGVYIQKGLAVFDEDRLAGGLTGQEAQMVGVLANQMRAGGMTFDLPPEKYGPGQRVSLWNVKGKTKIQVQLKQGQPFFIVKTEVTGAISELVGEQRSLSPLYSRQLETEMARIIRRREIALIQKLQSLRSDIINFGEQLRVQQYTWWKRHDWKKVFPTVSFTMQTKVHIVRNGVLR